MRMMHPFSFFSDLKHELLSVDETERVVDLYCDQEERWKEQSFEEFDGVAPEEITRVARHLLPDDETVVVCCVEHRLAARMRYRDMVSVIGEMWRPGGEDLFVAGEQYLLVFRHHGFVLKLSDPSADEPPAPKAE